MEIIVLLLLLTGIITQLLFAVLAYKRVRNSIIDYLSPVDKETPSPFYQTLDIFAQRISQHAVQSVKGTLMQANGVANRNERKLEQKVATNVMASNSPWWLRGILNLPQVQEWVGDNPDILKAGAMMLANKDNGKEPQVEEKIYGLDDY